jgi:hypothetical protein
VRFIVRGRCRDCEGDTKGCFDGGSIVFGQERPEENVVVPFKSRADAEKAGRKWVGRAPYEFEVEEVADPCQKAQS